MKKLFLTIIVLVFFFNVQENAKACTNFLVTRGASADGTNMITYAADSHLLFGELYFWLAMDWAEGTMLDVYEWDTGKFLGQIPQISHTYTVNGNMNEYQVAIGETTYGGLKVLHHQKGAIMDYGSLIYIALQRSKTAREAIKVMTELAEKYGYYSEGESFSISDPDEVWIMEMIGKGEGEKGAVWVARKIPDGYICGHANQARITTFPYQKSNDWNNKKQDTYNAKDVISFAKRKNLYKGNDKDFSFSDVYAPVDFGGARFCEIRVWAMFKDVNKDMQKYFDYVKGNVKHTKEHKEGTPMTKENYATNRMPLWVKPYRKITLADMMDFMRDHLENTPLDMSKDVGAGPFGMPYRWRHLTWKVDNEKGDTLEYCNERATATQQTGFSFVAQSRKDMPYPLGGIFWFSVDDAASTVYTPIYSASTRVPETFAKGNGSIMEFSDNAAFWVFNQVSNFAYTRYNLIHPEIDELQHKIEKENRQLVKYIDNHALKLLKNDKKKAREFITDFSVNTANALTYRWKSFYKYLFTKYMDGNVKTPNPGHLNPHLKQPGYSKKFYKQIVKETGDKFLMPK